MVKFEQTRERKKNFRGPPNRSARGRGSDDRRPSSRDSRDRVEKTRVTCSECKSECEVPFKPTSNKPIYCDKCFAKKPGSNKSSGKDLEIINEKLDKILKALENL